MSAMKVMLSLALLAASAIYITSADAGKGVNCCTKVSAWKPDPSYQIERYYIQKADPPCVEAVRFITNKKKIICAHPKASWVKKKQEELRKKEEENKNTTK